MLQHARLGVLLAVFGFLSISDVGARPCSDNTEGAVTCGCECYIYAPNTNCEYYATEIQCYINGQWVSGKKCRTGPCYI